MLNAAIWIPGSVVVWILIWAGLVFWNFRRGQASEAQVVAVIGGLYPVLSLYMVYLPRSEFLEMPYLALISWVGVFVFAMLALIAQARKKPKGR